MGLTKTQWVQVEFLAATVGYVVCMIVKPMTMEKIH